MLEVREWVIAILVAVVVTAIAVVIGSVLDIGLLRSAGWVVGVAVGLLVALAIRD